MNITVARIKGLNTKTAEEVAYHILPIFLTFGAAVILQSDKGREFCYQVIPELCSMWKDVKVVHGKPHHSQAQGSIERANQGIQNILMQNKQQLIPVLTSIECPNLNISR